MFPLKSQKQGREASKNILKKYYLPFSSPESQESRGRAEQPAVPRAAEDGGAVLGKLPAAMTGS